MGSGWVSGERTPPPSPCERAGPSRGRRGPRRRLKSPEADSLPGPLGGWAQGCRASRRLEMLPHGPQAAGAGSSVHAGFSSRLRESGSALCAHGPSCPSKALGVARGSAISPPSPSELVRDSGGRGCAPASPPPPGPWLSPPPAQVPSTTCTAAHYGFQRAGCHRCVGATRGFFWTSPGHGLLGAPPPAPPPILSAQCWLVSHPRSGRAAQSGVRASPGVPRTPPSCVCARMRDAASQDLWARLWDHARGVGAGPPNPGGRPAKFPRGAGQKRLRCF